MTGPAKVLFVIDRGGYPLFTNELASHGYEILVAASMRKALAMLKSVTPDVIVAEFNYGPRYGVLISNLEPLLSLVESRCPRTQVIALLEREHGAQLEQLKETYRIFASLAYPLEEQALLEAVMLAAARSSSTCSPVQGRGGS